LHLHVRDDEGDDGGDEVMKINMVLVLIRITTVMIMMTMVVMMMIVIISVTCCTSVSISEILPSYCGTNIQHYSTA
jgi:hypothetical protein